MIVLGVAAFYHDSACALVVDGELVAAVQEERFTRHRFDPDAPLYSFRYCLDAAGIGPHDIDAVAYYEDPTAKLGRQLWMELADPSATGGRDMPRLDATAPQRLLRERLGLEAPWHTVTHHEAHAATAFFGSGFTEAALFTADAVGEWTTTSYGHASPAGLELRHEVAFPDSIGLFYSALTEHLGFTPNSDEYKVMGLAAYGTPHGADRVRALVDPGGGGDFRLDPSCFGFRHGEPLATPRLAEVVGVAPRAADTELRAEHRDLAAAVQLVTEDLLLTELRHLAAIAPSEHLCYAGGVALNCVANARLRERAPFREWFVPPAPGDAGSAAGAALLVTARTGGTTRTRRLDDARLGPEPDVDVLRRVLVRAGVAHRDFAGRPLEELIDHVADRLARGAVVGWCRGRMEFGPRALGARSILADPRDAAMRDRINRLVKKREEFRPFAPAVVAERAHEFFVLDRPSPFMLETAAVRPGVPLGAVTHVDSSARVQTVDAAVAPDFHALIARFGDRTGVPVLLNTSFNVRGEPIVADEVDALMCFVRAGIDLLVVGDVVVEQEAVPESWRSFVHRAADRYGWVEQTSDGYTFFA